MEIFLVKSSRIIYIISIFTQLIFIAVSGHGGCFQIFSIRKILLCYPFWDLIFWLLVWITTRTIFIEPSVLMDMYLIYKLVKNHICYFIWTPYRSTTISNVSDIEINLLRILVEWIPNYHNVCLHKNFLILILLLYGSRLQQLLIDKDSVFTNILLYKEFIIVIYYSCIQINRRWCYNY